jgi:hypothetical protein
MIEANPTTYQAAGEGSLDEQNRRLKTLVAELLKTNQDLRFKLAALEDEAESLKRGLARSVPWAGMLV